MSPTRGFNHQADALDPDDEAISGAYRSGAKLIGRSLKPTTMLVPRYRGRQSWAASSGLADAREGDPCARRPVTLARGPRWQRQPSEYGDGRWDTEGA